MSYKFQRGLAKLSGSLQAEDGLVSTSVDTTTAGNIATTLVNGSVDINKLDIDGASALGSKPDAADLLIIDDGGTGANKSITVTNMQTFMQDNLTFTTNTDSNVSKANLTTVLASFTGDDTLNIGDADDDTNVVIRGNLQVEGTTTTVNSTTLTIDDRIITIGDGLTTINGAVTATAGFEIGSNVASIKLTNNAGGNNGFESSLPFKATSFHGDGSGLSGITADTAGGFSYNTYDITASAAQRLAGLPGFYAPSGSNINNPLSGALATTLHLSGGASAGDNEWANGMTLVIKAPSNASTYNLTVVASGSDTIDGEQQIVLESDNAAVTLVRCHATRWSIV